MYPSAFHGQIWSPCASRNASFKIAQHYQAPPLTFAMRLFMNAKKLTGDAEMPMV